MQWCLPTWHAPFTRWQADKRKVTDCPAQKTASGGYPVAGFAPCDPETLRKQAEQTLKQLGVWSSTLPMDVYALARNLHSERSSGTVEEWAVIGESTMNEARRRGKAVSQLLLLNKFGINAFGALKGQGRWASTRNDPTVGEVMVAAAILSGQTNDFSKGATSYIDPDNMGGEERLMRWVSDRFASGRWAWVGQLPNVPVRRTFGMRTVRSLSAQEMIDNQKGLADLKAKNNLPAPTSVCPAPGRLQQMKKYVPAALVATLGVAGALMVSYTMSEQFPRRWKIWKT